MLMTNSNLVGCSVGRSAGFTPLEDFAGVDTDLLKHPWKIGCVAHQPAGSDKITVRIGGRYPVAGSQGDELHCAADEESITSDEEGIGTLLSKGSKGCVDLADCRGVEYLSLQPDGGGGFLDVPYRDRSD